MNKTEPAQELEPLGKNSSMGARAPGQAHWDAHEAVSRAARGELSAELLAESSSRLLGLPAFTAAVLALATGAYALSTPSSALGRGAVISLAGVSLGIACLWALVMAVPKLKPSAKRDLSHLFFFALCLSLGLARHQTPLELSPFQAAMPASLLILSFAALVPQAPRVAFGVNLAAAGMDLLAWALVHHSASLSEDSSWPLLVLQAFLSFAAGLALSRVVHQLRAGIQAAQEIGSYRLLEPLGAGGMAEVWKAEHRLLARPAAVKLIRPQVLASYGPQAAERMIRLFLREAKATSQLSSPHTILLYDFGVTREGSFYYVMELLRGLDLKSLVERFGAQSPERTTHLLIQICRSLREAHARAYVHRDLKPANVFTCKLGDEYDFAKVLDFGLVLDRYPTAQELEDERTFVGTPAIMAPEMIRYQAGVDARADIYALGCIAYWLLTGRHVFEATSRADMLVMHAHQKPIRPSRVLGQPVPQELEALIMSCLEKNPGRRPQSAAELELSLSELKFETPWTPERASLWWKKAGVFEEDERPAPPVIERPDIGNTQSLAPRPLGDAQTNPSSETDPH